MRRNTETESECMRHKAEKESECMRQPKRKVNACGTNPKASPRRRLHAFVWFDPLHPTTSIDPTIPLPALWIPLPALWIPLPSLRTHRLHTSACRVDEAASAHHLIASSPHCLINTSSVTVCAHRTARYVRLHKVCTSPQSPNSNDQLKAQTVMINSKLKQ